LKAIINIGSKLGLCL